MDIMYSSSDDEKKKFILSLIESEVDKGILDEWVTGLVSNQCGGSCQFCGKKCNV